MAQQSSNGNRPKLSEKGLLTPDNCVVALIDHQGQMLFGTSNFDRQGIINNTVAIGKAARVFDVPVVLTTVETKSFSGNMWPQLRAVFPGQEPIERSSMNSWDDKNFVAAIDKSGRKKILIAGLWTEVCVALPTMIQSMSIMRISFYQFRATYLQDDHIRPRKAFFDKTHNRIQSMLGRWKDDGSQSCEGGCCGQREQTYGCCNRRGRRARAGRCAS